MTIREITDEIGSLYERMKAAVTAATEEGKPMSGEAEGAYQQNNKRMEDLIKLRDQHYAMLDAQSKAVTSRRERIGEIAEERSLSTTQTRKLEKFFDSGEYRDAFLHYLQVGYNDLNSQEQRAMTEGTDSAGGYLPATDFYNQLVKVRYLNNAMRQICNVIPLGTFKTDIAIETALGSAAYVGEGAAATENSPTFRNIVLTPYTLRTYVKVSNELIADAPTRGPGFNIEGILAEQMGRAMGLKEEDAFVQGDGSGKPTGVFTYFSASPTANTTDIGATTTAASAVVTLTDLINCVYALKRQYREGATWVMADTTFTKIRALLQTSTIATANGSAVGYAPFAWSMGDGRAEGGEPDRLLGFPVKCVASGPAWPAASAAGNVAVFGNFNYYHIGDRENISIKVARETFLANNQTGYFGFARHDGEVSMGEAFNILRIKA
jgi:hypothetical protein